MKRRLMSGAKTLFAIFTFIAIAGFIFIKQLNPESANMNPLFNVFSAYSFFNFSWLWWGLVTGQILIAIFFVVNLIAKYIGKRKTGVLPA